MRLRHEEIGVIVGVAILFPAAYAAAWSVWGPAVTIAAVTLVFVTLLAVTLGTVRRGRDERVEAVRQTQALLYLNSHLETVHPLPPLGGASLCPDSAALLVGLIQQQRPMRIVELGSGVSTIICAACLKQLGSGKVISLDHDERYAAITRENLRQQGLADWAEVRHAPIEVTRIDDDNWNWYSTSALPDDAPIDLLIVDGPPHQVHKLARYPAARVLFDRLAPNCSIFLDDTNRSDERQIIRLWQEEVLDGFDMSQFSLGHGSTLFRRAA